MDVTARVTSLVGPLLAAEDLDLVDVSYSGGALQVFVERPGGVDLDTLSQISSRLSRLLDEHDPVPGRYVLEVSSPGLERPLRTPDQFRRFVGATVAVKTRVAVDGERRHRGRLDAADDDGVVVGGRRLAYGDVERARTVFEWGPAPRPDRRRTKAAARAGKPA